MDHTFNKRWPPEEVRDMLRLTDVKRINFNNTNRTATTKVPNVITRPMWEEKQNSC